VRAGESLGAERMGCQGGAVLPEGLSKKRSESRLRRKSVGCVGSRVFTSHISVKGEGIRSQL
jgi:hypothetical protein